jgi:hypothetical protein
VIGAILALLDVSQSRKGRAYGLKRTVAVLLRGDDNVDGMSELVDLATTLRSIYTRLRSLL